MPGGNAPYIAFDSLELRNLHFQGNRATYGDPVLGGIWSPAAGAGTFESLVSTQSSLTVHAQGSEPGTRSDVCRESPSAAPSCPLLSAATSEGRSSAQVLLVPGFNTLYTKTTTGGTVSSLLKRRMLLIAP
jgi:hypothetical protein